MKWLLAALLCLGLTACSGKPSLDDEVLSDKTLNLEEFFVGRTIAHGQFQDVFGTVLRRFEVQIEGSWDGRTLTLVEDFVYEDGETEQRIWTLQKTGPDNWSGTAPGVLGSAAGVERGDTFNWKYRIDLPVRDGSMRVAFDDWMWLLSEDRLLNRAYVTRFRVPIGEATVIFERP